MELLSPSYPTGKSPDLFLSPCVRSISIDQSISLGIIASRQQQNVPFVDHPRSAWLDKLKHVCTDRY